MGKTVIIFCSPESIHPRKFIEIIMKDEIEYSEIVIFNQGFSEKFSQEVISFLVDRHIKVINIPTIKSSLRTVRALINYCHKEFKLRRHLRMHGSYDICLIHYCSWQSALWVTRTKKYYAKIIPVFYGGDVLRNKRLNWFFFKKLFAGASFLVFPNINSSEVFAEKTKYLHADKSITIQFPTEFVRRMLEIETSVDINGIKNAFQLPLDKIIVLCGHTATRAEQYEKIITSLTKCNEITRQSCYFVFMMTYAPDDFKSYQMEVEKLIDDNEIQGVVLKDYIPYGEILKLHYISDIHITAILTDAFSCFLQEELFAGSIILYGSWLKYFEIENNRFFTFSFDETDSIHQLMDYIVNNIAIFSNKSKINRAGIISIASEDSIRNMWKIRLLSD